jgi:ferredoxin
MREHGVAGGHQTAESWSGEFMVFVIAEPCVDVLDKSCADVCPVDCIYEGGRKLYINPDECIECGACMTACPNDAVYEDIYLPSDWVIYRAIDAEISASGASGGASRVGPLGRDHELIPALSQNRNQP